MAGDWDEEEVGLIWILRDEAALSDILEKVPLAGVLAGQLPGRLVESVGIPIWVYIHLEHPLHLRVVQLEHLRRVVYIRHRLFFFILSSHLLRNLRLRDGGGRGGGGGVCERKVEGFEGETG